MRCCQDLPDAVNNNCICITAERTTGPQLCLSVPLNTTSQAEIPNGSSGQTDFTDSNYTLSLPIHKLYSGNCNN